MVVKQEAGAEDKERAFEFYKRLSVEWGHYAEKQEQPSKVLDGIIPALKKYNAEDVVDIGCGGGRNSIYLAKEGRFNVTGVDSSREALEIFRNRIEKEKLENVHIVLGDATKIPLKDEAFDAAISCLVFDLGNTAERKKAVSEMGRILRPDGIGYVAGLFSEKEREELIKILQDSRFTVSEIILKPYEAVDIEKKLWVLVAEKKEQAPKLPERM